MGPQCMKITKRHIVNEIRIRYPRAYCVIEKTALGKGVIQIECNHLDCERIGQFVLQYFSKQIYTYFACHVFRRGRLSIFFKR